MSGFVQVVLLIIIAGSVGVGRITSSHISSKNTHSPSTVSNWSGGHTHPGSHTSTLVLTLSVTETVSAAYTAIILETEAPVTTALMVRTPVHNIGSIQSSFLATSTLSVATSFCVTVPNAYRRVERR